MVNGSVFGRLPMSDDASMSETNRQLVATIDQLTELVVSRFSALDRRLQEMEADNAEIRHLLRTIVASMERLNARLPSDSEESVLDGEEPEDGFLTPPPGHFLH